MFQETQARYDLLLTKALFGMCAAGIIIPIFHEHSIFVLLLQLAGAVGIFCLIGYLIFITLFLESCVNSKEIKADRLRIGAKCCQWASMLLSSAVIILLTII